MAKNPIVPYDPQKIDDDLEAYYRKEIANLTAHLDEIITQPAKFSAIKEVAYILTVLKELYTLEATKHQKKVK